MCFVYNIYDKQTKKKNTDPRRVRNLQIQIF